MKPIATSISQSRLAIWRALSRDSGHQQKNGSEKSMRKASRVSGSTGNSA
jgi:hypothetical protein